MQQALLANEGRNPLNGTHGSPQNYDNFGNARGDDLIILVPSANGAGPPTVSKYLSWSSKVTSFGEVA